MEGLAALQRALRHTEGNLPKHLRAGLKEVGDVVRKRAQGNAPHRSGRLAGSVKTSVTQKAVTVYSSLVYSRVQDTGGNVGRSHATHLHGNRYFTRAAEGADGPVTAALNHVLDGVERDFGS